VKKTLSARGVLLVCAATLFVGCNGSPTTATAPPRPVAPNAGQAPPDDALIYAFDYVVGVILSYPSGKLVSKFETQLQEALGACSDKRGDVFVSGSGSSGEPEIVEYSYGATSPSGSVTFSTGGEARSCSVDGTTSNVAAIIHSCGSSDWCVTVLPKFHVPATTYSYPSIAVFESIGYDGSGNLFLLGKQGASSSYALAELRKGAKSFKPISLSLGSNIAQVRTVQWDGHYITIEATYSNGQKAKEWPQANYRLAVSGSTAKVVETIRFAGLHGEGRGTSWIQPDRNIMVFADGGKLLIWKYPRGGKVLGRLRNDLGIHMHYATVANVSRRVLPVRILP
jgi:hypothetical protein